MKTAVSGTLPVAVGLLLCINASAAQKDVPQVVSKPLVAISGTDSHVKEPSYGRVTTARDWASIWARHLGTSADDSYRPLLEVDFDRCMVIVIFRGERIQTRRIEIESVSENADSIVIRFHEMSYGIHLGPNESPPPPEKPYAFIVLPRTDKVLVLEEKIWSKYEAAHNLPPKWKERARLEPIQTTSKKP